MHTCPHTYRPTHNTAVVLLIHKGMSCGNGVSAKCAWPNGVSHSRQTRETQTQTKIERLESWQGRIDARHTAVSTPSSCSPRLPENKGSEEEYMAEDIVKWQL